MMNIYKNQVVSLHYTLTEGTEDGELLEETFSSDPLDFIFGVGMMLPGFEAHLEGMVAGDIFSFCLSPEEAYGEYEEQAVVEIPIASFTDETGNVNRDKLVEGAPLTMHDQVGREFNGVISESKFESIIVDFNHPMSGRTLHFKGEILEVRAATPSELDHGHIHHGGIYHE